jgi:hypothetical protein
VTCTTSSVVIGDVGVFPGTAFTNTICMVAGRTPPATRAAAEQARTDFLNAYAGFRQFTSCTQILGNLAGETLGPGVYCLDDAAKAGTLTLTGPANGVWIFLVDGATGALTGTNFSVVMEGGGQPCNVFWAPRAAATMTNSAFKGNILAGNAIDGSITLTGGTLAGRVLANVAVTMTDASLIGCGASGALLSLSCKGKDRHKRHHDKNGHDRDGDDDDDDDDDDEKDHRHTPKPSAPKKGK